MFGITLKKENVEIISKKTEDVTYIHMKGKEKGIFFRSPIQEVLFDMDDDKFSVGNYIKWLKNPVFKKFQYLIGNSSIVDNLESWTDDYDFAGFSGKILCSPIYFSRNFRSLKMKSRKNTEIKGIISKGYESPYETVSGGCDKEETSILFKNGKICKITEYEQYKYTYVHISEKLIKES